LQQLPVPSYNTYQLAANISLQQLPACISCQLAVATKLAEDTCLQHILAVIAARFCSSYYQLAAATTSLQQLLPA